MLVFRIGFQRLIDHFGCHVQWSACPATLQVEQLLRLSLCSNSEALPLG